MLEECENGFHEKPLLDFMMHHMYPLKIESFNNMKIRADLFKQKLQKMEPKKQVAVVAHKNFFTFLYAQRFEKVKIEPEC